MSPVALDSSFLGFRLIGRKESQLIRHLDETNFQAQINHAIEIQCEAEIDLGVSSPVPATSRALSRRNQLAVSQNVEPAHTGSCHVHA